MGSCGGGRGKLDGQKPLEGRSPEEHPAVTGLNGLVQPQGTLGGSKAQKPASFAWPLAFGRADVRAANGTWVSAAGMPRRPL
jgi:hypothetical protein